MQNLQITLDGKEQSVQAQVVEGQIWFRLNGEIYNYALADLKDSSGRKAKGGAKSADKITAPMPGKVTKLFVSEGQEVKKGDSLLVMEAMKMEYTLKADAPGKVEKVSASTGDQVALGQLLVKLNLAGDKAAEKS
jgi:biotin carboxyl carrier protein